MSRKINLKGKHFGRLKVIEEAETLEIKGKKRARWLCECECGNKIVVFATYLQTGDTQSCGCLKKELEEKHLREEYDNKRIDGVAMQLFKGKEPRKDSSTGYRGVLRYYTRKSKKERFKACITVNGKRYCKFGFKTVEDAYYNGRLALEDEHLPEKRRNEND